ncbi:MAG: MobF family relaxase, partial [Bdellovibrionota bacterium]
MISPNPQTSLANARKYFREHLKVGDYYKEGESVEGEWFGEAAKRLNLKGKVKEEDFLSLCDGNNPETGKTLTARKNSTRVVDGKIEPNRRIFHDFVFRPPKSVSIVGMLEDPRIIALHKAAVRTALHELEKYAGARLRAKGMRDSDRRTSNIVAAIFEHDTSREQDPLIHTHAVIFNATFEGAEDRWKALQTFEMYKALPFADSVYTAELTRELVKLGYEIKVTGKSWEIAGVSRELVERFS